jgi:hypothetical protein
MKKTKSENLITLLYLAFCFILVIGAAQLFAYFKDNFEENQKVSAETLPPLPSVIKQNQIRYLIEEGYLNDQTVIGENTK